MANKANDKAKSNNYIHQLQNKVAEQSDEIAELEGRIQWLKSYVSSSKFRCGDELDGLVNVTDVLNFLG